jgi:hypothetical protein
MTMAPTPGALIGEALALAACGWSVLPLHDVTSGACSCGDTTCKPGKHPRTWHGTKDASRDPGVIRAWWAQWPSANLGIATGPGRGVWMFGPDGRAGIELVAKLEAEHGPLPRTPSARSGGGGRHYYFLCPEGLDIRNMREPQGQPLDVRGKGGLAVAPPSHAHIGGPRYEWEISPEDAPLVEAPPWLLEWLASLKPHRAPAAQGSNGKTHRPQGQAEVIERARKYLAKCEPAISGQGGHPKTFAVARAVVWGFDLGPDVGYELLAGDYNPRCQPPWSEGELLHKCEEADTVPFDKPRGYLRDEDRPRGPYLKWNGTPPRGPGPPPSANGKPPGQGTASEAADLLEPRWHLTDHGNSLRLAHLHGADLRHCHPWNKWLVWDGQRWRMDDSGGIMARAKGTAQAMFRLSSELIPRVERELKDLGDDEQKNDAGEEAVAAEEGARMGDQERERGAPERDGGSDQE